MDTTPLADYLLLRKSATYVGHIGHKTKKPSIEDLEGLEELIRSYDPIFYFIVREDPGEYTHAHFVFALKEQFSTTLFRNNFYKKYPLYKRSGQGGETPFCISVATKIEKTYKIKVLTDNEQILLKMNYQVKCFNESDKYYNSKQKEPDINPFLSDTILGELMCELYWKLNAKVNNALKSEKDSKSMKVIKKRIEIFFDKKYGYMKDYPDFQSPDLRQVVEILALFYETEGADLPHTSETVERYAMMIIAQYNPTKHTEYLIKKICNKYNSNINIC